MVPFVNVMAIASQVPGSKVVRAVQQLWRAERRIHMKVQIKTLTASLDNHGSVNRDKMPYCQGYAKLSSWVS